MILLFTECLLKLSILISFSIEEIIIELDVEDLIQVGLAENRYYDISSKAFLSKSDGVVIFLVLITLVISAVIGALVYMHYIATIARFDFKNSAESVPRVKISEDVRTELTRFQHTDQHGDGEAELERISIQHISELKEMAESNVPLFMKKFKELFVDFTEYLNNQADTPLNLAEMEVCAYTKLGYTTKEVAYYRRDSIRSVENRKYRIRRKLNLSRDTDFTEWILSI